jgi:hypothetical protein
MDKIFKIFIFVICNEDEIGIVKKLFDTEKYLHVSKLKFYSILYFICVKLTVF